jgi:hypothetical protein
MSRFRSSIGRRHFRPQPYELPRRFRPQPKAEPEDHRARIRDDIERARLKATATKSTLKT